MNVDLDIGVVTLDLDLGNTRRIQLILQVLTNVIILNQQVANLFRAGIPAGVPILDYANAQSMGIHFLSHSYLLLKPSRSHRW